MIKDIKDIKDIFDILRGDVSMSKIGKRDYRPLLHFTPKTGWINDPNGLVYENGNYHLFYQFYPHDTKHGSMHWGHALSRNLIDWTHMPIALLPDKLGNIFSGSAVYDKHNTSGFGTADNAPLITMFTHSGNTQQQSIAYSLDGIKYEKYINNPVIQNPGIKDFRDPKVFYNPINDCWSVVIAAGDHIEFYSSPDFKTWQKTGTFGPKGNMCPGVWECPDIFMLTAPDGHIIWVLTVSMTLPAEVGGPKTQYFLGSFDGNTFICDKKFDEVEWIDPGFDNYAAISYNSEELEDKIIIGWGLNWTYAADTPTNEYCGHMTLPRKLTLIDTSVGLRLSSALIESVYERMINKKDVDEYLNIKSEVFALHIEVNGVFTVTFRNDEEKLTFGINNNNEVFIERSEGGDRSFSEVFASQLFSEVVKQRFFTGSTYMDIIFDVSVLELFCDKGTIACNHVAYPINPYSKITISGQAKMIYYDLDIGGSKK